MLALISGKALKVNCPSLVGDIIDSPTEWWPSCEVGLDGRTTLLVLSDIVGNPASSIFDSASLGSTAVTSRWSPGTTTSGSNRVIDAVELLSQ